LVKIYYKYIRMPTIVCTPDAGLAIGRDLSFDASPLYAPTPNSSHILVVGGGVTGLVTSWLLLDRGYKVTILSSAWAGPVKRLTSQIAGALWEYPPAVCGHHRDKISLFHSKKWSLVSYGVFSSMAKDHKVAIEAGVKLRRSIFFFKGNVDEDAGQKEKMDQISTSKIIKGFRRGAELANEEGVLPSYGIVDAYEHLAPVIDTDKEVAGDESCYPIRGGLIRVLNDGKAFPKIESALVVPASTTCSTQDIVFIVPRNDNILLLGGTTEKNAGNLSLGLNSPIIERMRARCEAFLPELKNAKLDPMYPFAQGLRPFRDQNVRCERELRVGTTGNWSKIVHTYGHGGAGWSLSFGCAVDVIDLLEEAMLGKAPKRMSERAIKR
jgi:D-amino-acid oxidase